MFSEAQLLQVIHLQTDIAKQGLDLNGTMSLVVRRLLTLLEVDGAVIELLEGEEMVYQAVAGIASGDLGLRIPVQASLSGLAARRGEVLVCIDSETDARVDRDVCRHLGLRSMVVVPLRFNQTCVGVLKAMSRQPDYFSDKHLKLLGLLTELIAASMYFATSYNSDELFYRATHDGMTDLANRALFMDRLRSTAHQFVRQPFAFGVLLVDINGLKQVNDRLGHRAGDALIKECARRLDECARSTDLVARFGGDEFGVIVSPVEGESGIQVVEQRVRRSLSGHMDFEGHTLAVSGSVGAALCPIDGTEVQTLLDVADARMYQAKRAYYQDQGPSCEDG